MEKTKGALGEKQRVFEEKFKLKIDEKPKVTRMLFSIYFICMAAGLPES